jgi:tetratricopeptide (TPR) repeat protein
VITKGIKGIIMTIKNSIIILTTILSLHISAAQIAEKKFDQKQYERALESFDEALNKFSDLFDEQHGYFIDAPFPSTLIAQYIETIQQHKEQKEKELAERKFTLETSWKPLMLNILGGVFGISAISSGAVLIPNILHTTGIIEDYPSTFQTIAAYPLRLPYSPGTFIMKYVMHPIRSRLFKLLQQQYISGAQYDLGSLSLQTGRTLLFAGIAKYLFNKASSYANEIKEIENIIARDDKMIEILQNIKESKEVA